MSSVANWSYTAPCTIWRKKVGEDGSTMDEYGQPLGFTAPEIIMCDYQGGISAKIGDIGTEQVVKNTFWSEFDKAEKDDYILIGESTEPDPLTAGADEIMQIIRYADTFERLADDYAILTGV